MFLPIHEDEALREIACHGHCLISSRKHFLNNDFEKAAIYLDNAARSLRQLDKLKRTRIEVDAHIFKIEQIRGQQFIDKQVAEMRRSK